MSTENPINPLPGLGGPSPVAPLPGQGVAPSDIRSQEFTRILDELLDKAGSLDAKANAAESTNPAELKDAIAEAKQSLDAALSLGDDLLEAYRQAMITQPQERK